MYSAASSIHEAAWRGDAREVVGQVVADPSLLYARDFLGDTALLVAARRGMVEVVEALLDRGCEVDQCGPDGRTALMMACLKGRSQMVKLLLRRGAEPGRTSGGQWTALMDAACGGSTEVVMLLLRDGRVRVDEWWRPDGFTALWRACVWGHHDAARALLMRGGANPGHKDSRGRTLVQGLRECGQWRCLELLQGYERAWCLLRARAALDGAMAVNQAGLVPAWLRGRAGAGEVLQLPHVQLLHRPGQREEGEVLWQAVAAMSGGAFDMLLDMMV